jgi:hypothetical protein
MSTFQKLTLSLVLIAAGLQAGLHFFMALGELPAARREPLPTFLSHWQAVDHFMAARMPIVANLTLLLYLLAILAFARQWRTGLFIALVATFAMSAFEVVYTVTRQLPVNQAIQALDPQHLPDLASVEQLRQETIAHFRVRDLLSISAFVWLAFVALFSAAKPPASAQVAQPHGTAAQFRMP